MGSVSVRLETAPGLQVVIDSATTRGVNTLANATHRAAYNTTPVDTGRLLASIRVDRASKVGIRRARGAVSANTRYAVYVHEGTGLYAGNDYIRGNPLRWRNDSGPYAGNWRARAVRGQPAQPFLSEAYNIGRLQVGFINPVVGLPVPPPQTAPPYNDAVQQVRSVRSSARARV